MEINQCRICGNDDLKVIVDLGCQALSCRFPFKDEPTPLISPLVLVKCNDSNNSSCGLVQLQHNTPSDELYEHSYGYRSGLNETMVKHLTELSAECYSRIRLEEGDIIIDIGSNDCTLLHSYQNLPSSVSRVGIDPTGKQFSSYYTNGISLIPDYFTGNLFATHFPEKKAKLITSICMFYDLPDPLQFMKDIKSVLHPEGIWITEQSYIISMLETNSFDTICHEHLEYYAFKQIEFMANQAGLKIVDVSLNPSNGGSFRVSLTHKDNTSITINHDNINKLKEFEKSFQLDTDIPYNKFRLAIETVRKNLCKILTDAKMTGKNIYLYGASTKGCVMLQYFDIDYKLITAAAERNPEKYGRRTAKTDIPIVSEKEMREANPDMLLVLPWHFRDSFILREQDYLNAGGQLIFPLPKFEIYTNKKKAFVTGINGQIGHYLSELLLSKDYIVYGLLHKNISNLNPKINYVFGDLKDTNLISQLIETIEPDEIYNLAGETDTMASIENPSHTFDINARSVLGICESIKSVTSKKIKLFHANSAEIYKGLLNGNELIVDETSLFHPITPYAIAKLTSYWMIEYYRKKYGMAAYNGIIFTTESSHRHEKYLSKRVTNFVKYLDIKKDSILYVGNLNCCRDWIHAEDVANAIYLIMHTSNTSDFDDYIVSSSVSHSVKDFIETTFSHKGITLAWRGQGMLEEGYDVHTNQVYIKIDPNLLRPFEISENLIGNNNKLKSLGWEPKYSFEDIIREMLN